MPSKVIVPVDDAPEGILTVAVVMVVMDKPVVLAVTAGALRKATGKVTVTPWIEGATKPVRTMVIFFDAAPQSSVQNRLPCVPETVVKAGAATGGVGGE